MSTVVFAGANLVHEGEAINAFFSATYIICARTYSRFVYNDCKPIASAIVSRLFNTALLPSIFMMCRVKWSESVGAFIEWPNFESGKRSLGFEIILFVNAWLAIIQTYTWKQFGNDLSLARMKIFIRNRSKNCTVPIALTFDKFSPTLQPKCLQIFIMIWTSNLMDWTPGFAWAKHIVKYDDKASYRVLKQGPIGHLFFNPLN